MDLSQIQAPEFDLEGETPIDWYRPGPSIEEFHRCAVRTRVLIGGRGCGKTTGIAVETLGHAWQNAGARIYILRKTAQSNEDTTLETFEQTFAKSGTAYQDTGTSLFKKIEGGRIWRLPSKRAVDLYNDFLQTRPNKAAMERWLETVGNKWCSFVQFSGVPTTSVRASRFRGYECSLLILVEADQFERADVEMAIACLRWKSPDKTVCDDRGYIKGMGMILDTNPPSPRHWIAEWEKEAAEDANYKDAIKFWHIHTEENSQNLPPGYVDDLKRMYSKNPAMYQRMVCGQYADAFDGKPVLFAFQIQHAKRNLPFPKGAYLVRGWDFGTTHAIVWSAYWLEERKGPDPRKPVQVEYWWDLAEYFATQSDVERQCRECWKLTYQVFPFWNDRTICAGILDYCDPAGSAQKDTGRSITVLNTHGIFPGFKRVGLPESLALYNRLLEERDPEGNLVYRVDSDNCPMLYEASIGGYRYPSREEPGYGSDLPLKGPDGGDYDHICLVGETEISVPGGTKRLDEIRAGDLVLTRYGAFPVKDAWETDPGARVAEYVFSDGAAIVATEEHPVWVEGFGWRPIGAIETSDRVSTCVNASQSSGEAEPIAATRGRKVPTGCTFERRPAVGISTGTSGRATTGRSHPECTSTTGIGTQQTTVSKTSSFSGQGSTGQFTLRAEKQPRLSLTILPGYVRSRKSGTVQKRGVKPMRKAERLPGSREGFGRSNAPSAKRSMRHGLLTPALGFAPTTASLLTDGPQSPTTLTPCVECAEQRIERTATPGHERPVVRFVSRQDMAVHRAVYALTVDGPSEFFANGILVKNCDAARYAKVNALRLIKVRDNQRPVTGVLARPQAVNKPRKWR